MTTPINPFSTLPQLYRAANAVVHRRVAVSVPATAANGAPVELRSKTGAPAPRQPFPPRAGIAPVSAAPVQAFAKPPAAAAASAASAARQAPSSLLPQQAPGQAATPAGAPRQPDRPVVQTVMVATKVRYGAAIFSRGEPPQPKPTTRLAPSLRAALRARMPRQGFSV